MLSHFEQQALHDAFNFSLGAEGQNFSGLFPNSTVVRSKIGLFQCPSDKRRELPILDRNRSRSARRIQPGRLQQGELRSQLGQHPMGAAGPDRERENHPSISPRRSVTPGT